MGQLLQHVECKCAIRRFQAERKYVSPLLPLLFPPPNLIMNSKFTVGRELGEYALHNYTNVKAVHVNLGQRCKSTMEVNACGCGKDVSKKSPVSCCLPHFMHVSKFRYKCCILFDVSPIVTKSLPGPCQCSTGHRCSKTESCTGSGPMVSHPRATPRSAANSPLLPNPSP